jgi:hypothetical protein
VAAVPSGLSHPVRKKTCLVKYSTYQEMFQTDVSDLKETYRPMLYNTPLICVLQIIFVSSENRHKE